MRWYQLNPERFELEKRLLAHHHPGVKIVIKNGRVRVLKKLTTRKNSYLIEAEFSRRHPYSPMKIRVLEPELEDSPHRYSDDRLCLHGVADVGPETTAKIYLDWAVQWIRIYERWLEGRSWPKTNRGLSASRF